MENIIKLDDEVIGTAEAIKDYLLEELKIRVNENDVDTETLEEFKNLLDIVEEGENDLYKLYDNPMIGLDIVGVEIKEV